MLLRHYLEQGLSKAQIARSMGVSRRTLYHWIDTGQLERELDNGPVRYTARPAVARKIDRYREIIQVRLSRSIPSSVPRGCTMRSVRPDTPAATLK